MLLTKFAARGVDIETLAVERVTARRAAFEDDWKRRLGHLVQDVDAVTFDAAWETTVDVLRQVEESLGKQPPISHASHTGGDEPNART